jgi:hypothetical protein
MQLNHHYSYYRWQSHLGLGRPAFSIAHDFRVGFMLILEQITRQEYYVAIVNYTCCEVVTKCPQHADSTTKWKRNNYRSL